MKIALLALALALPLSAAAQAPEPGPQGPGDTFPGDRSNIYRDPGAGCPSILRQVTGEDRRYYGSRLDRQPPAQLLYAVDRQINGCHEVTFVQGRREPQAPLPAERTERPRR